MHKNKSVTGRSNICGTNIRKYRKKLPNISQRKFAEMLCLEGLELDKNAIQRIEMGIRGVTDIELKAIRRVLNVTYEELLTEEE